MEVSVDDLSIDKRMAAHLLAYVDGDRRLSLDCLWVDSGCDDEGIDDTAARQAVRPLQMQPIAQEYERAHPDICMPLCFVSYAVKYGRLVTSTQEEWDGFLSWMGGNCIGFWLLDTASILFSSERDAILFAMWNPFYRD